MRNEPKTLRIGAALVVGLIVPPAIMYIYNSLVGSTVLDLLVVPLVEAVAFVAAASIWRVSRIAAILTAPFYFIAMFMVLFWVGLRMGVYDWP